jgi:stage II sporulation protein D
MKAQAIAARTYAFTKASAGQHRPVCDCALYASSYDQVYAGWDKEGGPDGDRWVSAVDGTRNEIVAYKGQSIQAFYMSSSGGFTEDNENVWGGSAIPYLRGVCDPGDYTTANPNATWIETMSKADVTHDLGLGIGSVTGFSNTQRGVSGRIITTTVKGANGTATISGTALRSDLGLLDDRVWIDADRLITGAIRQKYDALDCSPGLATSRQVRVAGGDRQSFEDGAIYWSDATNAHLLSGALLDFYVAKGGPAGKLGFPVADQVKLSNGGTKAPFEHGTIRCTAAGDCQIV